MRYARARHATVRHAFGMRSACLSMRRACIGRVQGMRRHMCCACGRTDAADSSCHGRRAARAKISSHFCCAAASRAAASLVLDESASSPRDASTSSENSSSASQNESSLNPALARTTLRALRHCDPAPPPSLFAMGGHPLACAATGFVDERPVGGRQARFGRQYFHRAWLVPRPMRQGTQSLHNQTADLERSIRACQCQLFFCRLFLEV